MAPLRGPRPRNLGRWALVVAALILAAGAVGELAVMRVADAAAWVAHTNEVLDGIEALRADLLQAESSQRGLLLTGHPQFQEEFRQARGRLSSDLDRLKRLTADNPLQQPRLETAGVMIGQRFTPGDAALGARRGEAAARQRDTPARAAILGVVLAQVDELREEERRLLAERTVKVKDEARRAELLMAFRTVCALLIVLSIWLGTRTEPS